MGSVLDTYTTANTESPASFRRRGFRDLSAPVSLRCGGRLDRNEAAKLATVDELHHAVDLCVQRVIAAAADELAGLQRCATLANQDRTAGDGFATEALHAQALCVRVTTVF